MAAVPLLGAEGSEIEADSSGPPPKVPAVAHLLQECLILTVSSMARLTRLNRNESIDSSAGRRRCSYPATAAETWPQQR